MGDRAFFQIAVGLIPVLLFGITILGFWAIIAESVAISGAVASKPDDPTLAEVERIRAANLREEGLEEALASQHETKRWIAVEHRIRQLLEEP